MKRPEKTDRYRGWFGGQRLTCRHMPETDRNHPRAKFNVLVLVLRQRDLYKIPPVCLTAGNGQRTRVD